MKRLTNFQGWTHLTNMECSQAMLHFLILKNKFITCLFKVLRTPTMTHLSSGLMVVQAAPLCQLSCKRMVLTQSTMTELSQPVITPGTEKPMSFISSSQLVLDTLSVVTKPSAHLMITMCQRTTLPQFLDGMKSTQSTRSMSYTSLESHTLESMCHTL